MSLIDMRRRLSDLKSDMTMADIEGDEFGSYLITKDYFRLLAIIDALEKIALPAVSLYRKVL